jgi:hypothetical protein
VEKNKQNKKKSKLYSTRKNPIKKLQTMMVVGDPALSSRSTKKTSVVAVFFETSFSPALITP